MGAGAGARARGTHRGIKFDQNFANVRWIMELARRRTVNTAWQSSGQKPASNGHIVRSIPITLAGDHPRKGQPNFGFRHAQQVCDTRSRQAGLQKRDHGRAGRKLASHASQWRVSTAGSGASALRQFAGGLSTSSATGDETHFSPRPAAEKDPLRRLSVPDPAQPSVALAVGPCRRDMERAIGHGPCQPTVAGDHRPIGETLAGSAAVPTGWRGHVAIARCRCSLRRSPRLSRRKPSSTSGRLVGPGRRRYRYHSTYPRAASGARRE